MQGDNAFFVCLFFLNFHSFVMLSFGVSGSGNSDDGEEDAVRQKRAKFFLFDVHCSCPLAAEYPLLFLASKCQFFHGFHF